MLDKIFETMRLLFLSVKDKLDSRYGCFEIFGLDFLLTENLDPKFMDITSCPSFSTEMVDAKPVVRTLLRDVVVMAQDLHEKNREKARESRMDQVLGCGQLNYKILHREPGDKDVEQQ